MSIDDQLRGSAEWMQEHIDPQPIPFHQVAATRGRRLRRRTMNLEHMNTPMRHRRRWAPVLAGGLAAAAVVAAVVVLIERNDEEKVVTNRPKPTSVVTAPDPRSISVASIPASAGLPERVAGVDVDGDVAIWSTRTGQRLTLITTARLSVSQDPSIRSVDISADGTHVVWAEQRDGGGYEAKLWDSATGTIKSLRDDVGCLSFDSSGRYVALGSSRQQSGNGLQVYDIVDGTLVIDDIIGRTRCPMWSPDGTTIAYVSVDEGISESDSFTRRMITTVEIATFSKDFIEHGEYLASDEAVLGWTADSKELVLAHPLGTLDPAASSTDSRKSIDFSAVKGALALSAVDATAFATGVAYHFVDGTLAVVDGARASADSIRYPPVLSGGSSLDVDVSAQHLLVRTTSGWFARDATRNEPILLATGFTELVW